MHIEEEVYLEHYGIPGMKWGVRRSPAKRLDRMNANSAMTGYGLRGYAAGKVSKSYIRKHKDPSFDIKKYEKLPVKERKKYDAKIKRKAYTSVLGRAVLEPLLVAGVGSVAVSKLNVSQKDKEVLKQGALAFTALSSMARATQVKSIRDSYKTDKLRKEVYGN